MNLHDELYALNDVDLIRHPREIEYEARYRAYCFGQFLLFRDQEPLGGSMWRRNKAKSLLKWFLLHPGKLFPADQLIDLIWPQAQPETALSNLHVTTHYLRHLLEPTLASRQESTYIRRNNQNVYWFHMDDSWWTDLQDVQYAYEQARILDQNDLDHRAMFYYRNIVNRLSAGIMPEEADEKWLHPYFQRYEYIRLQSLIWLIKYHQNKMEFDEVLEYAYQVLTLDAANELAVDAIIQAYLQRGNVTRAARILEDFRRSLPESYYAQNLQKHAQLLCNAQIDL